MGACLTAEINILSITPYTAVLPVAGRQNVTISQSRKIIANISSACDNFAVRISPSATLTVCISSSARVCAEISSIQQEQDVLVRQTENDQKITISSLYDTDASIYNICDKIYTYILFPRQIPTVNISILCSVAEDNMYELFMVKEGAFILFNGETFNVLKNGL